MFLLHGCGSGRNGHAPAHRQSQGLRSGLIQSIRDKPETLIRAIKDAQAAATYMDYKAGLITDKEYEHACGSVLEVKQKERDRER